MTCAFCNHETKEILDYGEVALAGAFLKPEDFASEKKYRLRLHFCEHCFAVQVPDRVPPDTLFKDYFYFSSATETMVKHFKNYAKTVVDRFKPTSVVEIGCNDGVLLKPLADLGIKVTGIDPSNTVTDDPRITIINDFLRTDTGIKTDMILANNVFAHIEDIHEATSAITDMLTDDGVFIFEVNALDSLISGLQYDWVYHEHLYYYSLLLLENHLDKYGLRIFDLQRIATHAGSIRYFACKDGRLTTKAVTRQREMERWMNLDKFERFERFAKDVKEHQKEMESLNGKLAGYGACGRTNTLLQACNIKVDYIVDDAPAKQGYFTPGTHIPIVSREMLDIDPPDAIIVFAWSFLSEIEKKTGNHSLIIPLPHIYEAQQRAIA